MGESRSVYVTLAFAGVALMVAMLIGVVVLRRRSNRFPSHQVRVTKKTVVASLGLTLSCDTTLMNTQSHSAFYTSLK